MAEDRPKDAAGWRAFGARLEKAGAPLRAAGLGFGWHNHDFEFIAQADGSIPQASILEGGPSLEVELDVAWVIRGGSDPLAWINRYAGRITAAHVKDIAPKGQNVDEDGWADVGHGTVDWKTIHAALKAAGWIPGAQIAEAAILAVGAVVAGATTFGVGKAAIQYFQSGRSLDSGALRMVFDAAAWDYKRRGEAASV
jgi:sugar phosphate isomerase/epimerase